MYKRLSAIMFPIILVALIGTGMWGYMEHQEKNSILIKAENQYQRAFHDLSFHIDKLQRELGNTLAVNTSSHDMYRKGLINVWRLTSQAQNEINQLPLTLLPFNKTEEFLANVSKFTYRTAVRDLTSKPLTPDEVKTLQTLHKHSKEITDELRGVQNKVIANNLRWMDVEVALASEKENKDNTIVDGFKTVDKKVSEYPEMDWGPSMMSIYQKRNISMLQGNEVTVEEVKEKAAKFLDLKDSSAIQVVENGTGTEYGSFSATVPQAKGEDLQVDYSKKGGHMIWFMKSRDVPEKRIDIRAARDAGLEFLDNQGIDKMTALTYDEYQNVASITFARRQDDIIIYPEKLVVKVALDNGDVIGLQASDYLFERKDRKINPPVLSKEEALSRLNPQFELSGQTMALIKNELDEEVLCYQFSGKINGSEYKIYINAEHGSEEKIEQVRPQDKEAGK